MPISRQQFLNKKKQEEHSRSVVPQSEGLPSSMKMNDDSEDVFVEVYEVEEDFIDDTKNIKVYSNEQVSQLSFEQQEIQRMQMELAQNIQYNQPMIPPSQPYNYNPIVIPSPPTYNVNIQTPQGINQYPEQQQYPTQYLNQAQVFQQPLPQQIPIPPPQSQSYEYYYPPQPQTTAPPQFQVDSLLSNDEPLYVVNLSTQAFFFTDLFGPETQDNECIIGTVDEHDPTFKSNPYMTIPANKKKLALQHEYFFNYLQNGFIKCVSREQYQTFKKNYKIIVEQAIERRKMLQQIAASGGFDQINNQQRYQQQMNRSRQVQIRQDQIGVVGTGPLGTFEFLADTPGSGQVINPYMSQIHNQLGINSNEDFLFT